MTPEKLFHELLGLGLNWEVIESRFERESGTVFLEIRETPKLWEWVRCSVFLVAIISRLGPPRFWRCSKNCSPQNHRLPTAPVPANSIAGSALKPAAPAFDAGPSKTNSLPTPATKPHPSPSNAGGPGIWARSGNTTPARMP